MDPDRRKRAEAIFHEAADLPLDERSSFLARACGADDGLRADVERLLEPSDDAIDQFLETPAFTPAEQETVESLATLPTQIGKYTIVRKVGEGGMGVVYEAKQEHPSRSVALKVIRPDLASRAMRRRFELEVTVLGRLQHPGIAHVYDAGMAIVDGNARHVAKRPFFAMEFIRGAPLTRYAEENKLSTRQRLALVATISDAVHYAHQQGVIHRDLKPANILVDSSGQPKILDFGVARLADEDVQGTTLQTGVGQLVGTLPYMSPEQVVGDSRLIDTSSDVYALGVILYELLAGRTPHDLTDRSIPEAARMIRDDEPFSISTLDQTLRGDVAVIVGKAIAKDKAHRYASATELAADIRRFLSDQPIVARPPSAIYQLRKFARRHKAATFAGIAIMLALAGATAFASVYAVRAERARKEAQRQAEIAAAINQFLNDDLLASVAPSASRDAGRGRDVRMVEVLQEAARRIEAACAPGGAFQHKPEVEAAIRLTLGRTLTALGDHDEAYPHLARAYSLRREELGAGHADTLGAAANLGGNLFRRNQLEASAAVYEEALRAGRNALGAQHPLVLDCERSYANVFWRRGEYEQALQLLNHVFEARRRTLGPDHGETLAASQSLALVYKRLGRYDEAETIERRVLAHNEREVGADHPDTLRIAHNLGTTLYYAKNHEAAEAQWRDVLEQRRRVLGPDHHETLSTCLNLGSALVEQGRSAEAEPIYRAGYDATLARYGESSDMLLNLAFGLANSLRDQGRFDEAEPLYQDTIRAREASIGLLQRKTIQVIVGLYDMRMMQGRTKEAEAVLARPVAALRGSGQLARNSYAVESLIAVRMQLGMEAEALGLARAYGAAVAEAHGPESEEAVRVHELVAQLEQESAEPAPP